MSKEHQEGYAGKHPESAHLEEKVASALNKAVENGRITCAAAHGVAKDLGGCRIDKEMALDLMEDRLLRCQLGLFGYTPEKRIVTKPNQWDAQLEKDIREALKEGRLPCADAWAIARRRKVPTNRRLWGVFQAG